MNSNELFGIFFVGAFFLVYIVIFLSALAIYILNAIAVGKIAKSTYTKWTWLSWIPIGQIFLLIDLPYNKPFELIKDKIVIKNRSKVAAFYLVVICSLPLIIIPCMPLLIIPIIGMIIFYLLYFVIYIGMIAFLVIFLYRVYVDVFDTFNPDSSNVGLAVLSALLPITSPFVLFHYVKKYDLPVELQPGNRPELWD